MNAKNKTKKSLFILLAALLATGSIASYWYVTKPKKITNSVQVSEATKKEAEVIDAETAKSAENKNSNQDTQQQSSTSASPVSVTVTSLGNSSDNIYVNALVEGSTSGTCKLTLTNGSSRIEKSASVGFQVSYYICQGFSVPSSELVPKGEWNALIELTSPNGTAKSEVKKVTVQ